LGAAVLGSSSNILQTVVTNAANGRSTADGLLKNGIVGGIAGLIAGPVTLVPNIYDPLSPWLNSSIASFLNNQANVMANVTLTNGLRNLFGGTVSNVFGGQKAGDSCGQ
jgi:hypothetical protein